MSVNPLVAQSYFGTATIVADAAAVSLRGALSPTPPTGLIASLYLVGSVTLGMGTADSLPVNVTAWPLAANIPFTDSGTGVPSDQGPNIDNLYLFCTGSNSTVSVYLRTR